MTEFERIVLTNQGIIMLALARLSERKYTRDTNLAKELRHHVDETIEWLKKFS